MKLWAVLYYGGSEPDSTEMCGVFASEAAANAYIRAWGSEEWRRFYIEEHDLVKTAAGAIKLQKQAATPGPNYLWGRERGWWRPGGPMDRRA